MTTHTEVLEYCIGLEGWCFGCPGFEGDDPGNETCVQKFAKELLAKRAEVEELRGLIKEILPVGDIADGLAPYYIEADTIHRMRKALEGKE
jgi:hypothetical protein